MSDKSSPWLISKIVDKHNHPMLRGAEEHSRSAQKLDSDMLSTLKDFSYAGLRMSEARKMLQSKYPTRYFHGKTIRNVMYRVRADISNHLNNRAMELTRLLNELARNEDWFVATDISKIDGRLNRVFWMDPEQRCLYRRYHDVVLNDTTAQTNPFGMPLNVTVVIDNSGASRVVALALTRSEATSDFRWILRHIMTACAGNTPGVLVVDEDKAMESASREIFPDTYIMNCIWHMHQNFKKFVRTYFHSKKAASKDLLDGFQLARDAITIREFEGVWWRLMRTYGSKPTKDFEDEWSRLMRTYGSTATDNGGNPQKGVNPQGDNPQGDNPQGEDLQGDNPQCDGHDDPTVRSLKKPSPKREKRDSKIQKHFERLYKRRFHWARPWTGTCFTAGVRSTQRVEKAHHLIKRLSDGKCSLVQLVKNIDNKVKAERQTKAHLSYQREVNITAKDASEAKRYFGAIQDENKRYLGEFGRFETEKEMASSFYYKSRIQKVRRLSNTPLVYHPYSQVAHIDYSVDGFLTPQVHYK
jgi:hypothetical protein